MFKWLLLAVAAPALAQPVEVKGFQLGAPKAELLSRFPWLACRPVPASAWMIGEEYCSVDHTCLQRGTCSRGDFETYGGVNVWGHSFGIVNGRVEQFTLTVKADDYEKLRNALVEAHGKGQETSTTKQTRAGAAFDSRSWKATKPGGLIIVVEHGNRIDEGSVFGESQAFIAWRNAKIPADAKKGSKDL